MPMCVFNKVAQQFYSNHTSALVFSCKFAAYFQNTFSQEHLWVAASDISPSEGTCCYMMRVSGYMNSVDVHYDSFVTMKGKDNSCHTEKLFQSYSFLCSF